MSSKVKSAGFGILAGCFMVLAVRAEEAPITPSSQSCAPVLVLMGLIITSMGFCPDHEKFDRKAAAVTLFSAGATAAVFLGLHHP